MREIKFRAFEESAKEWNNAWSTKGKGKEKPLQEWYSWEELQDYSMEVLDGDSQFTIMQFTGLKDKNGIEIYEGDIIELINDAGKKIIVVCEYGIARRHVLTGGLGIEVDIPCFYFKLPNGKKSFPIVNNYAGKHDLELFEVVGNIYSNPELLNQK